MGNFIFLPQPQVYARLRGWLDERELTPAGEGHIGLARLDAHVVAERLAKAYIRPGGAIWTPYAIYAGATMVGFLALACEPDTDDQYWLFHFFIDQRFQRRGYGRVALQRFVELVRREYPQCQTLQLVVHPENTAAQRLYTGAGFQPTGAERWGEPVYQFMIGSGK